MVGAESKEMCFLASAPDIVYVLLVYVLYFVL